jgi:Golgi phosphoprotein 3 (GPP34)
MHEQPASRSGGYRHRGPPPRGLSGTGLVADDLYLLGHDESGKPLLQPAALGTGLAGALLVELMLVGWIGLRQDGAVMITTDAPRGAVQQNAMLKRIADKPAPQPVRSWLRLLGHSAAQDVALRLEEAGYLERARGRVPWRQGRWVPVNPDWAFAPVLLARSALDPTRPLRRPGRSGGCVRAGLQAERASDPGRPARRGRRGPTRPRHPGTDRPDQYLSRKRRLVLSHLVSNR